MVFDAPRRISFGFWISCLILFIPGTTVSTQSYLYTWCSGRGYYTADSKFQDNLNRLLYRRLYDRGHISGFYNTTEGEYPDKVYGLFPCRIYNGIDILGLIDILYKDDSVLIDWIVAEMVFGNLTDFATKVKDVVRNVTDLAISSESLYATININVSSSVTLHELARCTPVLSKLACKSCLLSAIVQLSTILSYGRGGAM
ncbi:hypothetical protein NL676_008897 [Syzygium grande]|nr:hypothetical protein NL676_008897 [Syzygium grande]